MKTICSARPHGVLRLSYAVLLLFIAITACQTGLSQSSQDPQAVAALNAALTAMGGQAALSAIQDATVSGQSQPSDPAASADSFVWKSTGMSIRHEYTMTDGVHVSVVDQGQGSRMEPSGQITTIDPRASLTILPYHLPGIMIVSLLGAANVSLTLINDPVNDGSLIHVSAMQQLSQPSLSLVTRQDWLFDPVSGLPIRVSIYLPDNHNQRFDGTASIVFTQWQTVSSVQVPQSMQLFFEDELQSIIRLNTPTFNQGLPASTFQLQ